MSFFKEFDELFAMVKDPGIMERKRKIATLTMGAWIADMILAPLAVAASEGRTFQDSVETVHTTLKKVVAEMIRDLEAIDKPMPPEVAP